MKRKVLSLLLALVMIFSLVPAQVFAVATGNGSAESPWQIGDTVTNDGSAEPEGVCVDNSYWVREDIAATETQICELAEHSHAECVYDEAAAAYTCGLEAHAHDGDCHEVTEAYTLWTLTEMSEAKEQLRLVAAPLAETEYTVTFRATNGNRNVTYLEIYIYDADGNTVDYVTTNSQGRASYDLPAGTYTAEAHYTSGNYVYSTTVEFTVTNSDTTVNLNTWESSYSLDAAETTYNNTTYFNHVDIRVKGTYTTGTTVDMTTYNIRLANVHISVTNPSAYSAYDFDQAFTDETETYEWKKDDRNTRIYKGASVTLTCDIYDSTTGEILKSGFTYTFYDGVHDGVDYGNTEFVKAIQQCDAHQGLDFIINPLEIIEAVFLSVSYDWDVVDAEGTVVGDLPEGLATLPAAQEDAYESGDEHTIDTHHVEGHYVIDEANGKLYTFQGWDWWSHESDNNLKENAIGSDQTTVTVTDDTVIYGVWVVSDLELADSHITVTKKFVDENGDEIEAPADYYMLLVGPRGGSMELSLSQFTYENGIYSYELPVYTEGEYTIAEHAYAISGYEAAASVTVQESASAVSSNHDHVTAGEGTAAADSATFSLDLDYDTGSACAHVGEVDFVNTYTKIEGADIHNYPNLAVNKLDGDDRTVLKGATFVLYENYSNGQFSGEVATGTSNDSGYLYFLNLEPGTYYLVETEAPEGYLAGWAIYRVTVTLKDGFPTQILSNGAWCDYYEYDMSVDASLDDGLTWAPSQHFSLGTTGNRFRLAAFNEKVSGQLTIEKSFTGLDEEHIPVSVTVTVTYPDGTTTDHVLNAANDWTVTLTGLELGTYTVSEGVSQIDGYEFLGATYNGSASGTVEIDVDDIPADYDRSEPVAEVSVAMVNTYEKKIADYYVWPELNLLKVRDADKTPLAGATFTVYEDAACTDVFKSFTTDAAGKAMIYSQGQAIASDVYYYLKETAAPAGYALDETVYVARLFVSDSRQTENPWTDGQFYNIYYVDVQILDAVGGNVVDSFDADKNLLTLENTKDEGSLTLKKTFGVHNAYIPAAVTATVTGPNGYSRTVTLNAANNWTVTLTELALGTYTVTEPQTVTDIDGHPLYTADSITSVTVTLSSGVDNGADLSDGTAVLKNTYTREVINPAAFQVKKVDSVTGAIITTGAEFTLYSDSACTQVVQVENTGADGIATFYGFTEAATYYLKETAAPEYYALSDTVWQITVSLKDGDPTIKVNEKTSIWETIYNWIAGSSHSDWANGILTVENVKKTGNLTVTKVVEDPQNHYTGVDYSFTLDASDDAFDATFTLKAGESKSIENIPYGTTYTVTEDTTGAAYTCVITDSGNGKVEAEAITVTATNTYAYQVTNPGLNLLKVNAETNESIAGVLFNVYYDAECTSYMNGGTTNAAGEVNIFFPSYDYSTYYLKEVAPAEGYYPNETVYVIHAEAVWTVKNAGTAYAYTEKEQILTIDTLDKSGDAYVVKNTPILPVKITVTKQWDDGGYYARPQEVTVTLLRDTDVFDSQILSEDNDWTYTWEGAAYTDQYTWSVDELTVPEGYTKAIAEAGDEGIYTFDITNSRTPKPVEITVTKAWEHKGGKNLPESIAVTLYKNNEAYETVTLSESNGWTHTWTGLTDVYQWSVDEVEVPAGYEKEIEVDGYSFTITNTRIPVAITVDVEKVWNDGSSEDRPDSVDVVLYCDGTAYETVTLNEDNDWCYSWDLTDEHDWTVDETEVPDGYKKTVEHNGNSWTITNTLKKIPKTGDESDLLGLRVMGIVGVVGFACCAMLLVTPRKKKEER